MLFMMKIKITEQYCTNIFFKIYYITPIQIIFLLSEVNSSSKYSVDVGD